MLGAIGLLSGMFQKHFPIVFSQIGVATKISHWFEFRKNEYLFKICEI